MSAQSQIDPERALMVRIKVQWGSLIGTATKGTARCIPESFVAALSANESGGVIGASRYEPAELGRFAQVLAGDLKEYQGITSPMLLARILVGFNLANSVKALVNHCSSWGPTQIMGWQTIKLNVPLSHIAQDQTHFPFCITLLQRFIAQYGLDPRDAAAPLFRCWNTGQPNGVTSDPDYVPLGIARMKMYEALP